MQGISNQEGGADTFKRTRAAANQAGFPERVTESCVSETGALIWGPQQWRSFPGVGAAAGEQGRHNKHASPGYR